MPICLACTAVLAGEDTAVVGILIGNVEFCPKGSEAWQAVSQKATLAAGDKIRTKEDGMVTLLFTNGSVVTLKQNTEFEIQSLSVSDDKSGTEYRMQLTRGKLKAIVEKIGESSTFEIKTPTAVAAVRGTIFYLFVREVFENEIPAEVLERLVTELFVELGEMLYTNSASGKFYVVGAEEESNSYGDGSVTEPVYLPPDKQEEWKQGWEDIMAAEPYQAPPEDLGYGDGEDGDNEGETDRQANQSQSLLEAVVDLKQQHEKDVIRQQIKDDLLEREYLRAQIYDILAGNNIRQLEGYIEKIADAQMGKVMTDIHGNRVRAEQYVLRPSSAEEGVVEVLNVNLRAGDDMTTMQWITKFNKSLDGLPTGSIKGLPWDSYLDAKYEARTPSHINSPHQADGIYPTEMSVQLAHQDDYFKETRFYGSRQGEAGIQSIDRQTLSVNNFNNGEAMAYAPVHPEWGQLPGTYYIDDRLDTALIGGSGKNPTGFRYNIASADGFADSIVGSFYVISEAGARQDGFDSLSIRDIHDALRVNMSPSMSIGSNNLEMIFASGLFEMQEIDLIYAPLLTGMEWKSDANIVDYSWPTPIAP